ncbi:MAG: ATP-binding protein [Dehalococcoidia bacterium]
MIQVGLHNVAIADGRAEGEPSAVLDNQDCRSRKMEALGRLAAGVAHDLNNLLTIIAGYSDILSRQEKLPPDSRRSAHEIKRAAERAFAMTRQLLSFSRKESAQTKLVNLGELLRGLAPLLSRSLGENIALETVVTGEVPRVKADPVQLERMFMNLASNARDAMPGGGSLRIEVQRVTRDADAVVRVIVTDTGCGMDAETQAHLFEPFFTTKRPGQGTGFSLATVYGVVTQSHGKIRVSSEVGHGTSFIIELPATTEPDEQAEERGLQQADPGGTETVLVVEDEQAVRAIIRSILLRQGYRVLEAHDGFEAIRIACSYRGQIHAVLTDAVMPGVDGRTLGAALTFMRPDSALLYMSGYPDETLAQRGLSARTKTVLSKPFTPTLLIQELRTALDRAAGMGRGKAYAERPGA